MALPADLPSTSRRTSRPTSLHIDHPQDLDVVVDTSPPSAIDYPDPPSHTRSRSSLPADSPCFLHSNLNQDASLTDWLKTRGGPNQSLIGDLGVARSLQPPLPNRPLLANLRQHLSPDSDGEDEFVGSLTKQLAETAVGVREMSKQLGANPSSPQ